MLVVLARLTSLSLVSLNPFRLLLTGTVLPFIQVRPSSHGAFFVVVRPPSLAGCPHYSFYVCSLRLAHALRSLFVSRMYFFSASLFVEQLPILFRQSLLPRDGFAVDAVGCDCHSVIKAFGAKFLLGHRALSNRIKNLSLTIGRIHLYSYSAFPREASGFHAFTHIAKPTPTGRLERNRSSWPAKIASAIG